ncbi:alpha-2 adrenergic receptor [Trichonephila clavipes]|uniref:Alpha-2 adrenergic receptor n=1 Tax=Trichonephila clavipes TaxID=2585209 RepID=A0A8X6SHN7_TRICX|nr:alpha-2 adrenergic receptor [Trichonephila clavipes]
MKIGNNGNLLLAPFDESMPFLMIVLMNCQTKLRINHLTAVKSVAILESIANLNFYTWKKTFFREELIMGHEDELTIEFQEILNEEHHEKQRNVSPSKEEEDER